MFQSELLALTYQQLCEIFKNDQQLLAFKRILNVIDTQNAHTLRILIVDDNAVNRKVLQSMLNHLGYAADMVTNGKKAIQAMEEQHYDLVFMDLQMPIMDGLRAARTIRRTSADNEHPYIIAITAYADRFDRETCINAGMNDYLSKPATLNDIRVAVQSAQIRLQKKERHPGDGKIVDCRSKGKGITENTSIEP